MGLFAQTPTGGHAWRRASKRPALEGAQVAPEPILAALEGAPHAFQSSMQKDVAAGRAPELDAIAGPILRGGDEHGIDVSGTQAFVDRIARVV